MPNPIFHRLQWQDEKSRERTALPLNVQEWLFWQGSLTAKLKQHCREFEVKVRSEKWMQKIAENETALFPDGLHRCREVTLYGDNVAWVEARTLIAADLFHSYTELAQLGTMPLGEWLFVQAWERRRIQWAFDVESGLYARRSLFFIRQMPLLVAELFLESSPITD